MVVVQLFLREGDLVEADDGDVDFVGKGEL